MNVAERLNIIEHSSVFAKCVFMFNAIVTMATATGFQVAWACEQCNKTVAMFLVSTLRRIHRKPTIVVVAEAKINVGSNVGGVTSKLQGFGSALPSEMQTKFKFMSGEKRFWDALMKDGSFEAEGFLAMFKEGRVVPVIQAHGCVLDNMRKYLVHHGITGVTVLLDEGDKVLLARKKEEDAFAKAVAARRGNNKRRRGGNRTRAHDEEEEEDSVSSDVKYNVNLKALLSAGVVGGRPLGPGALCDGLVIVSATHLATMQWLEEDVSPNAMMQAHLADQLRVRGIGYSTGDQLKLHMPMDRNYTAKDRHGCDGEEIQGMFDVFREDYMDVNKRGALMMAAMGSAIFSNGNLDQSTNLKYATTAIQKCPEAVIVVHSSRALLVTTRALMEKGKEVESEEGVRASSSRRSTRRRRRNTTVVERSPTNPENRKVEDLWVDGHPGFFDAKSFSKNDIVKLLTYDNDNDVDAVLLDIVEHNVNVVNATREERCTLGGLVGIVDDMEPEGMRIPIICLGYELLIRSISVRSSNRVITHMVVNVGDNKNTSDVRQMLMRSAGYDADGVRLRNGFQEVKVCMTRKDFECSMKLPAMLRRVLTPFVGAPRAVREWRKNGEEYTYFTEELKAVVDSKRFHTVAEASGRRRIFDDDKIFVAGQSGKKQKMLKQLLKSGQNITGCDLLPQVAFKMGSSVPLVIQLDNASELADLFEAELRTKTVRPNTNTFTSLCADTVRRCTVVLDANEVFSALREVDNVFGIVLCGADAADMRTLINAAKNNRRVMPVRSRDYLPRITTKTIRSVHVDVGEWKAYVVDGDVTAVEGDGDVPEIDPNVPSTSNAPVALAPRSEAPELDFDSHLFTVEVPDNIFDDNATDLWRAFQRGMDALDGTHPLRALVDRWGVSRFDMTGHDSVENLRDGGVLVLEYLPGTKMVKVDVVGRIQCDGMFTGGAMRRPNKLKHVSMLIIIKALARLGGHFTTTQVNEWVGSSGHRTILTSMRNAGFCGFDGRKGNGKYVWAREFTTSSNIIDEVVGKVKHHDAARRNRDGGEAP